MNAATNSALPTAPGTLLAGKYRVDRVLGQGGMGIVLAATNEALQQRVAIKLLREANTDSRALGRFEREARAAARLRSEHVARVLDVGKLEDGRPYMVMEYLEGCDLGYLIDEGTNIPIGELVDYVLQACEGIAEAHAAGIIHRDIKPRNLFLSAAVDGRPLIKVLDFGISKIEDASADEFGLTRTTEVIGSPSYMSPEQLRASKDVDLRTDIWALGVILYELITKRVPFHATTITELVAIVLMDPTPDVRDVRPDVPEGLSIAIQRCLAKRREDRFSGVAELAAAISPYGTGAVAGMAEKISRVAQGSGRSLPPSDTGSGAQPPRPVDPTITRTVSVQAKPATDVSSGAAEIHESASRPLLHLDDVATKRLAGTGVSWGETNSGLEPKRRSKLPQVASAVGLVLLTAAGAGSAALYYARHTAQDNAIGGPLPVEAALPATSNHVAEPPKAAVETPSSASSSGPSLSASSAMTAAPTPRAPDRVIAIPSAFLGKAQAKSPPAARSVSIPGAPSGTSSNDLSEIGRH